MNLQGKRDHYGAANDVEAQSLEAQYAQPVLGGADVLGADLASVDAMVRRGFIRKVFAILCTQLMVTFGVVAPFLYVKSLQLYVQENIWVYWTSFALLLTLIITLTCCNNNARTYPQNYILLGLFTLVEGVVLGVICSFYTAESVLIAVGETVAVTLALTLFATCTKYDFTDKGPYLFAALFTLIMFGFLASIFAYNHYEVVNVVYSSLGCLIFSMYIVYDVQLIVGGKHKKHKFSVDDYVFAALSLYLDVINLFLMILSLGGNRR